MKTISVILPYCKMLINTVRLLYISSTIKYQQLTVLEEKNTTSQKPTKTGNEQSQIIY